MGKTRDLFNKIRDNKGKFHAKMGSIKDRKHMDLTFQVPMQYCSIALDLASIASHIHNWVLFLLWLRLFILSGVISPLISSSLLGTYRPGKFIFQCYTFLPFHTIHMAHKARILKWFDIPFSSGPLFVRTLQHDPSILDHAFYFSSVHFSSVTLS